MGSNPTFRTKFAIRKFALSERSKPKGSFSDLPSGWSCYLLLCSDGSYYCGLAAHLARRLRHHSAGKGTSYTKANQPVALVWYESHQDRQSAAGRERQLKGWSHGKKKKLAEGHASFQGMGVSVWVSFG